MFPFVLLSFLKTIQKLRTSQNCEINSIKSKVINKNKKTFIIQNLKRKYLESD